MKKSITLFYLAILLGVLIGSCTPCDDGDAELNTIKVDEKPSATTFVE